MRETTHRWVFDGVALAFASLVLLLLPWASQPVTVPPFVIGVYGVAIFAADLCTAILLIRQYRHDGDHYLLVLLAAYLMGALLMVPLSLSFPGAFGTGQFIGHESTAAILFLAWRILSAGLLLLAVQLGARTFVAATPAQRWQRLWLALLGIGAAAGILITIALTMPLAPLTQGGRFNVSSFVVGGLVVALALTGTIVAFVTRARAKPVFGWVALVLVATVGEMALSTLSGGRFTLGWYVSRCITVVASYLLLAYLAADFARELRHRPEAAQKYAYVAAAALAVCAVLLRYFLVPWLGYNVRYATLFGAVAIAVWMGGWRPAVLTAALGYVLAQVFLNPEILRVEFVLVSEIMSFVIFCIACSVIIALGHNMRAARERFRKSQEAAIQGYGILRAVRDRAGRIEDFLIEYVNPRGAKFARVTPEAVTGRKLTEVLPGVRRNHVFETLRDVTETGRPLEVELRYEQDGLNGWFRNMIVKVDDGVAVSFFDVTRARRLEQELAQRASLLERADTNKSRFLATLSHELRNPLAPLRNGLAILKRRGSAEAGEVLGMMDRQLTQMVRLVDDLLDVSRIDRGKIDLRRERVPVDAMVSAAIETARPSIDAKSHELVVHFAQKSLHVDGDPVRLAQIVSNLLINAAKFTPARGHIELALRDVDGNLEIIVRDNGMGIEPEQLPRVFEMFVQLDRADNPAGGLGLGLALVRSLVELHGGRVQARSEGRGKGSEFIVRLPLAAQATAENPPQRLPAPLPANTRHVLVVDDNEDAARTLGVLLESHGHDVRCCFSAAQALDAVADGLPDVAFLDLNMPHMDGFELARRLRARPGGGSMRLVAVTGMGRESDVTRTREAGFDAHLTKPADPDRILQLAQPGRLDQGTIVPFARSRVVE
jgi:signal transduction histidine kinase/ActR/RegA family two-component response regulator